MSTTAVALMISGSVYMYIDHQNFRTKLFQELIVTADIIAENNTANILFHAPKEAEVSLASLKANKNIVAACIYDQNHSILASFKRKSAADVVFPTVFSYSVSGTPIENKLRELEVFRPIVVQGETIGSIYMISDLQEFRDRTRQFTAIALIILAATLILVYLVTRRIQRLISDPIIKLAEIEHEISEKKDYSIRIPDDRKDEIGSTMRAFNEMLEQIEYQNTALIKAKDIAIESEKAKEAFLANMSHEIRTPLNAILGLSDLLNQTTLSEEQRQYIQGINGSGEQLMSIINDILDFSKIQSGKFTLELISFSFKTCLEDVLKALSYKSLEKNIEIHVQHGESVPDVIKGDPYRLKQILTNLVSNAIKFTESGQITISTEAQPNSKGGVDIKCFVRDTGIGISRDKLHKIFESFTQADDQTSRMYGGTGLGLAICKNLIELQGGTISVESIVGQGSTFIFTIPYRKGKAEDLETEEPKNYTPFHFKGLRVLCVDDYPLNLFLLNTILEKQGINVDNAKHGQEAIEKLELQDYDLVFMDIQMPVMDGIKATEHIRRLSHPQKSKIPIIALTANAIKGEEKKYLQAGMNDYLLKPFKALDVFLKIQQFVHIKTSDVMLSKTSTHYIQALHHITGNDADLARTILMQYVQEWELVLAEITQNTAQGLLLEVKSGIHKIKPSVSYLALEDLEAKIMRFEKYSDNSNSLWKDDAQSIMIEMQKTLDEIKQELKLA